MVRKYPNIDRVVGGYGRLKYYLTHPYQIEKHFEEQYNGIYHKTIGYLIRLIEYNNGDLDNFYNDTNGVMKLIYEMFGFSRLTHYILYTFNQEKEKYYSQIKYQ
jgi:hypothetical protein